MTDFQSDCNCLLYRWQLKMGYKAVLFIWQEAYFVKWQFCQVSFCSMPQVFCQVYYSSRTILTVYWFLVNSLLVYKGSVWAACILDPVSLWLEPDLSVISRQHSTLENGIVGARFQLTLRSPDLDRLPTWVERNVPIFEFERVVRCLTFQHEQRIHLNFFIFINFFDFLTPTGTSNNFRKGPI